ncbi:hypothetical protein ACHAXN_013103 [Cyclotella atomus]
MILDLFRGKSSNGNDTESCMCDSSKNFIVNEDRAAFSSYAEQSGLPTIENWPNDTNSIVTPSQRATEIKYDLPENNTLDFHSLPMNGDIVRFTGPNFEGKLVSRMRDVPLHPCKDSRMTNAEYFKGRSRQYAWTVQGRFKRRIRFDQVVTGQEFGRPFRNTPSSTMVKRGLDMLKHKLPETFECDLFCQEPRFEHPLIAGCQSFRVDRPENVDQNDIHGIDNDGNIIEDTSLLSDPAVPQDGVARRKYFSKNCNLERFYFETEHVYTFDFYANFFSPARHRLELTPFFSVDLIPYFNGYPLFMSMAKDKRTGEYFWATEIWHKRLLKFDERPGGLHRFLSGSSLSDNDDTITTLTAIESIDEKSEDNSEVDFTWKS